MCNAGLPPIAGVGAEAPKAGVELPPKLKPPEDAPKAGVLAPSADELPKPPPVGSSQTCFRAAKPGNSDVEAWIRYKFVTSNSRS